MISIDNREFPLITAHSGAEGTLPNSPEFVHSASAAGADFVELDLRITADGIPVFLHDPDIQSFDGTSESVEFNDFGTLKKASGGDLVEGKEILAIARDVGVSVNLDMKVPSALTGMRDILKDLKMTDRTILSGLHLNQVIEVRKAFPEFSVMLNLDYELDDAARRGCLDEVFREGLDAAVSSQCTMINLEHVHCREDFVLQAHKKGIGISIWTVDKEDLFHKFVEMKVNSITTNAVSILREKLNG